VQLRHAQGTSGGFDRSAAIAHAQAEGWQMPRALRLLDHLQAHALSFKKPND
jgi:hypothetical protein